MDYNRERNVLDIFRLNPNNETDLQEISDYYIPVGIHEIEIDGNKFTNYGQYQFIYRKTYGKSPSRSLSGSMGALNSLPTFLTPNLILDFSIMSIDDYRRIMRLHYEKNEFKVKCYDPIYNRPIQVKMYFATEEMAKLYTINRHRFTDDGDWEDFLMLVGVEGYKVEMIGTNNDVGAVTLFYDYNAPLDENGQPIYPNGVPKPMQAEDAVEQGDEVVVGANSDFADNPPRSNYKFMGWVSEDGTVNYKNGDIIRPNEDMTLKAVWGITDKFTLSFDYGVSPPKVIKDEQTGVAEPWYSKEVQYLQPIGKLPSPDLPYVENKETNERRHPYTVGQWYSYPVKNPEFLVTENTNYRKNRSSTIYYLVDKVPYTVKYDTTGSGYTLPEQKTAYGEKVYTPNLAPKSNGATFQGWYTDADCKNVFNGTMPALPDGTTTFTLYAKWQEK